jgi:hypothetical protein
VLAQADRRPVRATWAIRVDVRLAGGQDYGVQVPVLQSAVAPAAEDGRQSSDTCTGESPAQVMDAVLLVLSMTKVTTVVPAGFFSTIGSEVGLSSEYWVS